MHESNVGEIRRRNANTSEKLTNFDGVFKRFQRAQGDTEGTGGLTGPQKAGLLAQATSLKAEFDAAVALVNAAWEAETAVTPYDA